MKTRHELLFQDARNLSNINSESVDLIVTSPPYPMIRMWDEIFSGLNPAIKIALNNDENLAFELMHKELDLTWKEAYRVLKSGGIACINIGDSTRTIGGKFQLFPNHSRVIKSCFDAGFHCLPEILWRKQTNAPNKFMGSGMLPVGAYVTLEHEYILILRKGEKREFGGVVEKALRQESAFFWEERNRWFSDIWEGIKGINQKKNENETSRRSAAYPIEIPYRLINMFSVKGDLILDPYLGTGTTTIAAMTLERNSIGVEIDKRFRNMIISKIMNAPKEYNELISNRVQKHLNFIEERKNKKDSTSLKYKSAKYHFPVMTRQELNIFFRVISDISHNTEENIFEVSYKELHPLL